MKSRTMQEESWAADPNAFVADEDDEMVSWNVRAACTDFVTVRGLPPTHVYKFCLNPDRSALCTGNDRQLWRVRAQEPVVRVPAPRRRVRRS